MTIVTNDVSRGRQALRREVNERIRSIIDWPEPGTIDVFCECGRVRCTDRVRLELVAFDDVLGSPGCYVVVAGHEGGTAERVVARQESFVVVDRGVSH